MRSYRKWILTLGIMAVTPGITMAGPFSLFKRSAEQTPAAGNQNQKVAESIAGALRRENMSRFDIDIEYKRGVATLTGQISDMGQKAKVSQIVSRVEGVRKVDNRLAVLNRQAVSAKAPRQSRRPVTRRESPIQQVSNQEFDKSPFSGVQTGAYEVPAPVAPKRATPNLAASNQQIAEQIAKVMGKSNFKGYDIEIRFINGIVILSGEIGNPQQRAEASHVAGSVPGVRAVDNRLIIAGQPANAAGGYPPSAYRGAPYQQAPYQQGAIRPVAYQANGAGQPPVPPQFSGAPPAGAMMGGQPGMPGPPSYGHPGQSASHMVYNSPNLPEHAWPSYASYPNSSQVTYPKQYSASAWPYIGPFYPYPQIPLGWRQAQLEWDDGSWNLNFKSRTDKWWWFLNPENW